MPNRIIKESICTSEDINELSDKAEIFFYRLMVNCDDYGIIDARPSILRSKCYPLKLDTVKDKDIEKWLHELIKVGLIFIYEKEGRRFLKMTSWEKHQQIRAKRSKYPQPDKADYICNQMISNDSICPRESESESEYENPNPNTNTRTHKNFHQEKNQYAENVSMTNAEYEALIEKLGENGAKRCIEILDNYKGASGKKYKSDYRAILNWVIQRYEEEQRKKPNKPTGNIFLEEDV